MKVKRLQITSREGHFGKALGYDDRETSKIPQPSTIMGMLRLIYGEDILEENFRFGYTFKSGGVFKDGITIYKHTDKGPHKEKGRVVTNIQQNTNHYNCELVIYTDLNRDKIEMSNILSMGKSGNPAQLVLPIIEIDLQDKEGKGCNQYTDVNIGSGVVQRVSMVSKYNQRLNSYDHQKYLVRYNEEFDYHKGYDEKADENVYLWEYKEGEVRRYD